MKTFLKLTAILFSILLGLVFLYSAYTKLYPVIETFEFSFVEIGIGNWYTAPIEARLMIGLEFFIGGLLISNYKLKAFSLPLAAGVLLFFIIYLSVQIAVSGNEGNCGCFGEHIKMSPLQAIIKNLVMLVLIAYVYKFYAGWQIKYNALLLSLSGLSCVALPFVVNPIDYTYSSNNLQEKINYPLELNLLYHPEDTSKVEVPKIELREGKHVLAFLSLSCPHCRIAAKKFRLIKRSNPELSIYFVLNGGKEKLSEFLKDTKAENIPYSFCLGKTFVHLASAQLPRIYYLDNSIVIKKVDYYELSQSDLENWMIIKNR
ncbi:MAG: hypothetical protein MUF75_00245 [Bacteroidia bacterium]|nr:hypothetical protein [Bacteroidia bacterium]